MTFGRTGLAVLALFVVSLGYGVVVPALPTLAGGRAATHESELSLMFAAYSALRIGCQIPGGLATDRRGPVAMLRLALPAFVLSLVGFLFTSDTRLFIGLRALEGAATGLTWPACFALALRDGPAERGGRRLSTLAALGTSGLLLGPALGAAFAETPRTAVLLSLVPTALLALWVWRRGATRATDSTPSRSTPDRRVVDDLRALADLGRQRPFLALMAPIAFNKLTFSAFQGLLPLVCADRWPGEPGRVLALFVVIGVVFAAAQPVAGFLADRVTPRALVRATTPCLLAALAGLAAAEAFAPFLALFAVYIFTSSLLFTATMKHGARTFGTEDTYGGVFGLLATLTDLATIVGPLIFINVYGHMTGLTFAFMAVVGLAFAAFHARYAPHP